MLNDALKQIRLFHNLKQVELAHELGISKSYLSEIESKTNPKPVSLDLLKKYSDYFDIPMSSLMLLSENIDTAKASDNFRLECSKKIIKLLEWVNARSDINSQKEA